MLVGVPEVGSSEGVGSPVGVGPPEGVGSSQGVGLPEGVGSLGLSGSWILLSHQNC